MNELTLIKKDYFEGVECDFYTNEAGDVFMTSDQLGRALGYAAPRESINKLVQRNESLATEEFSSEVMLTSEAGLRNTRVFTEDGILETTMLAKTELALKFRKWVREVVKGIRRGNLMITTTIDAYEAMSDEDKAIAYFSEKKVRKQLEEKNKILEPQAAAYQQFMNSEGLIPLNEAAKSFDIPVLTFYNSLREAGLLMIIKDGRTEIHLPTATYDTKGYFEVRQPVTRDGNAEIRGPKATWLTKRGFDYVAERIRADGSFVKKARR